MQKVHAFVVGTKREMEIFILIPYSEAYIKKYKWKVDCVEFQVNVPEVYEGEKKRRY